MKTAETLSTWNISETEETQEDAQQKKCIIKTQLPKATEVTSDRNRKLQETSSTRKPLRKRRDPRKCSAEDVH